MNKWYQGIVVEHKELDNKMYHCFDDENFEKLTNERNEQLKEIERLNKIINSFLAYLKDNEEHWKDTSYNWDSLIYGELAQRLEMKIEMSLEESDEE